MEFANRLSFQSRIVLVTLAMVALVVAAGGVTIERMILPVVEADMRAEAWRIADGVRHQIRESAGGEPEQLKHLLEVVFQVRPKLLYVELLGADGKPLLRMGEPEDRPQGKEELLERRETGTLFFREPGSSVPIYEIVMPEQGRSGGAAFSEVRIGVSGKSLRELTNSLFRTLLLVALTIIGVSFVVTRWFTGMITRPVGRLLHMTHLLSGGRLKDALQELQITPHCLQKIKEVPLLERDSVGELCPFLCARSASGPPSSGHCQMCPLFHHEVRDELTRLLAAFCYMTVRIWCYQERLQEQYEFEERMLDACPDGIIANDREGRIILYNKGAERLMGFAAAEMIGQVCAEQIYPPGKAREVKQALLCDGFGGPGVLRNYSTHILAKDGRTIPIRLSATLLNRQGQSEVVVGYFHDLTELNEHVRALVQSNQDLNEANDRLARLNRHYLEMLSFVTHELKSPIANGFMSANALRQEIFGSLAPEQSVMVEAICRNLDQSMEMIRHYLDLSRIEKDELPVNPQLTRLLSEVVEPVLKGLAGAIAERKVTVTVDVPEELEWSLDPELFRGVFTNLLSNALTYGEISGQILITAQNTPAGCRMRVWNSGPGISPADHEQLFRKFGRLQTTRSARGTGLGLFITKSVVERHAGSVRVESEAGKGVSFIIELPRA